MKLRKVGLQHEGKATSKNSATAATLISQGLVFGVAGRCDSSTVLRVSMIA